MVEYESNVIDIKKKSPKKFFCFLWGKKVYIIAVLMIVLVAAFGIYFFQRNRSYSDYKVQKSLDIESGRESKYIAFGDFVLKYSTEGVSYINGSETIWDEAYDMSAPVVDVSGSYAVIADKNTSDIILYDENGKQSTITTDHSIVKVDVAKQGVIAVLLNEDNANYIEIYDKTGDKLVSQKTLVNENGYPVNFALSDDGKYLMVSYLVAGSGSMEEIIRFYDFSDSGQNYTDYMAAEFSQYGDTVVPAVSYVSDTRAVAVGEDVVSIFNVAAEPRLIIDVAIEDDIDKVFYNEEYVGLVFPIDDGGYTINVYNMKGKLVLESETDIEIEDVSFAGDYISYYDSRNWEIVSLSGVKKFSYEFKEDVLSIIPQDDMDYILMFNNSIQKVRIK